jgi:hypothetical protein
LGAFKPSFCSEMLGLSDLELDKCFQKIAN